MLQQAQIEFGTSIRATSADAGRPVCEQINETVLFVRKLAELGTFARITAQHHWLSYPSVWTDPLLMLSRLAPEADHMRLLTSVIKLALHNPVEMAEQVVTLDHISGGRFDFGIAVGYQEAELEAVGISRKDRVPRLEESLELMKLLWAGDEVTYQGRFWKINRRRMGFGPVQKPHPPIWVAAQSVGAAQRAARIGNILLAPQVSWKDLSILVGEFGDVCAAKGRTGLIGVNRNFALAKDRNTAIETSGQRVRSMMDTYRNWDMREKTTLEIVLDPERDYGDWAIIGSAQECVDTISRYRDELGLNYIGLTIMNMPKEFSAKMDYVQRLSEDVLSKVV